MLISDTPVTLDLSKPNKPHSVEAFCILGDRTPKKWYKPYYRKKWLFYEDPFYQKRYGACNIAFTLNADCRVDFDVYDKTISNQKLFDTIDNLIKKDVLQKITCVYEYGKGGKEAGKLHYHGIIKCVSSSEKNNREIFEKEILKVFNKNLNLKHRTLHTKILKTVHDRHRYITYMKKEQQNYYKSLLSI